MSTQIIVPAPRRISFGKGWLVAATLVLSLGMAATIFLTLRHDGVANSKAAPASVAANFPGYAGPVTGTGPGLAELGSLAQTYRGLGGTGPGLAEVANADSAAAIPNAHNSAGFKRAAERPGWAGSDHGAAPASDTACGLVGRQPC